MHPLGGDRVLCSERVRRILIGTVAAVAVCASGCGENPAKPPPPPPDGVLDWAVQTTGERIRSIWGSQGGDLFAVGPQGAILHTRGASWTFQRSGTDARLNGVWGASATDVFAVGVRGGGGGNVIRHYDGTAWSEMTSGASSDVGLGDVWGASGRDVFAIGNGLNGGEVVHYDGNAWTS